MENEEIKYPNSNQILHAFMCLKNVGIDRVRISKEQYNQWYNSIDPSMKEGIDLHFLMGIEIVEHDC